MSEKILRTFIALAALFLPTLTESFFQPPYQVTIMLKLQGGELIHLCNGCIIYERMIATTANCVHFRLSPKVKPTLLEPSALSVWAGSTNGIRDVLKINVTTIDVAAGFNIETLENDLALLTLSQPLLLGIRPDMQWIMLDDSVYVNDSCLVNFFSRSLRTTIPNYYQTVNVVLYNNAICRNSTTHSLARRTDVCSIYVLPQEFSCEEAESFLAFNNDRGSGLICKNYLVGLLSSVVTRPDPKNNCSDVTLTAMYTNIYPHMMWVYSVMNNIETRFISTPYDGSFNPLLAESDLNEYGENEIIPELLPEASPSELVSPTVTTSSTSVTEDGPWENLTAINSIPATKEGSSSLNETTLPPPSAGDVRDKLNTTNATSSIDVIDGPTTFLPPISENTTNEWSSTTIRPTLVTEAAFSEKASTLQSESIDNVVSQPNSTTISILRISETKENETENTTTINPRVATEATTTETTLPPPSSASTLNVTTTSGSTIPSTDTSSSDPLSFESSTTDSTTIVTDSSEESWNPTSILPSSFSSNTTSSLVAEAISTTLPSQSNVQQATNQLTLANLTADVSSEEDISTGNDTTLQESNVNLTTTSTTTFESVEDSSTTITSTLSTTSPLLRAFNSKPTTPTAPSPTLAQAMLNYTILWPLPTVQLEPLKESPQTSIGRLFRSSATTSQLNAFSLLIGFAFLKLIFNH